MAIFKFILAFGNDPKILYFYSTIYFIVFPLNFIMINHRYLNKIKYWKIFIFLIISKYSDLIFSDYT